MGAQVSKGQWRYNKRKGENLTLEQDLVLLEFKGTQMLETETSTGTEISSDRGCQ